MTETVVLIHVDGPSRAKFFAKLSDGLLSDPDLRVTFLTESHEAQRILGAAGKPSHLLAGRPVAPDATTDALYDRSLCGALGTINRRVAAGYHAEIQELLARVKPGVIWCWNGSKFIDRVLKASGIDFIALEVANIPGCFVVERGGVNAESATYRMLTSEVPVTPPEDFDLAAWRAAYIATKEGQTSIPQASVSQDEAGDKLRHLLSLRRVTPRFVVFQFDRILGYALKPLVKRRLAALGARRPVKGRTVFFPQQVSSDSQLIFNADHDNLSALRLLLSELGRDTVLVSNLHPAEHRLSRMIAFLRLVREDPRLIPATSGAWELIKSADEVVTINSTVGLEAAILGRPCRFLGKSFFSRLSRDDAALKWYLGDHILPYSSASETPADPRLVARLFPHAAA
jgi:capsular polysaccharide export protein